MTKYIKLYLALVGLLLCISPTTATAATDMSQILINIRGIFHPIMILILWLTVVSGIALMFRGFGMLKAFGMPLTQATRPGEVAGPLVYITVGAIMVYMPTTTEIISASILGGDAASIFSAASPDLGGPGNASDTLLGYAPVGVSQQWADLADTIVYFIEFIGFIAFVRGWFIISHAGQPGVQPGSITKGIVHLIGGIIAINFIPFMTAMHNTIFA